jgi:thiol-disulfide isomerase/thioredoxin
MEKKTIVLILVLILIAGAIVYLQQFSPNKSYSGSTVTPGNRTAINAQKALKYEQAKEIALPSGFVNVDNITIGSLVGKKVILVDFWTYSCINCERTIPYLNMWYTKYHDQGLEIVGVHSPEFQFEHNIDNVRQAVKKFGIQYPVVLDNDFATWGSYKNQYWPEDYLIDIDGFIVDRHIGEGDYDATEKKIQDLLRERADALGISINITNATGIPSNAVGVDFSKVNSPETYFGSAKNGNLGNGQPFRNGVQNLTWPGLVLPNTLYLDGTWNFTDQYAVNTVNGSIIFQYDAKNVYLVASADKDIPVTVSLDGTPISESGGADVIDSVVTVKDEQLYTLVEGKDYGVHTLELDSHGPGLRVYTFTFG